MDCAEDSSELRREVIGTACALDSRGLTVNAEGNVSVRCRNGAREGFLITPSGALYQRMGPDDLVFVADTGAVVGSREPSSEWRLHQAIYASRAHTAAIVHTHSPCATAVSCHARGLPAFHYMVGAAGGTDIRCAEYATFGTQDLADRAVAALDGRKACLLAHHGVVAAERTLERALALAIEVEQLARTYLAACALGEPPALPDTEMQRVLERMRHYGHTQ